MIRAPPISPPTDTLFPDTTLFRSNQIWLENGKPILFDNGAKGLTLDRERLKREVVEVVDGDWEAAGVIVHDETNKGVAQMLIDMPYPAFPIALGVIYCDPAPSGMPDRA